MFRTLAQLVPDFPKPCVKFLNIGPVLADPACCQAIWERAHEALGHTERVDVWAGLDSRGYLVAALCAAGLMPHFRAGVVRIAKDGAKIGSETLSSAPFNSEYGSGDQFKVEPALVRGKRVVLVDDICATAQSLLTAIKLIQAAGGVVVACIVLIDVKDLRDVAKAALAETGVPLYVLDP